MQALRHGLGNRQKETPDLPVLPYSKTNHRGKVRTMAGSIRTGPNHTNAGWATSSSREAHVRPFGLRESTPYTKGKKWQSK